MERRQPGQRRGPVMGKHGLHGRQDPAVRGDALRERAFHRNLPVAQRHRCRRAAAYERPAAPSPGVLDRLQDETRLVLDQPGVGSDRRGEVGQELSPYRDDAPLPRQGDELVPARGVPPAHLSPITWCPLPDAHYWSPITGRQAERPRLARNCRRSSCGRPVWQAPAPSCSTTNSRVSPSQS